MGPLVWNVDFNMSVYFMFVATSLYLVLSDEMQRFRVSLTRIISHSLADVMISQSGDCGSLLPPLAGMVLSVLARCWSPAGEL